MKRSKRFSAILEKIDTSKSYPLREALSLVKEHANARFEETVEIHTKLGIDPRRSDQMVRGTVSLPHGTGKEKRILVITGGAKEKEAMEAGADFVGEDDVIEKIQKGWLDFDAVIATPDVMPKVGKLGKILGPRGLMPNPKLGTVTFDIAQAVKEIKKGKIEFKVDKTGVVHIPIGKVSFQLDAIYENAKEFLLELSRARPSGLKGVFIKSVYVSSTMGPGIKVDMGDIQNNVLR